MRKRGKKGSSERGIVLIVILWGVIVLAAIAFALTTGVRMGTESLANRKEHLEAYYLARGAIYQTLGVLLAPPSNATEQTTRAGPQREVTWRDEGWQTTVEIADEAGKLNLNHVPARILRRLLEALGLDSRPAQAVADAIEEWRRPDPVSSMNEADDSYYLSLPRPYRPEHANFRSTAELLLVRGITQELYYGRYVVRADGRIERQPGLVDCVTVDSPSPVINVNAAPYPVLLAIPGMEPQIANYIVEARERRPFTTLERLREEFPASLASETLSSLTTQRSGWLSLRARAQAPSGVAAQVRVLVELHPAEARAHEQLNRARNLPFRILRWDDSYAD